MSKLNLKTQNFFKREFSCYGLRVTGWQISAFFLLAVLYFSTRLFHLTILPIFCDEAIYVRWSQVMRNEPTLRFLPLSDGKQPLFMWLTIPALKVFSDPLFAGRFVSVVAGLGTLLGVVALSFILYQHIGIAITAGLIYVLLPFTLFFDKMALVDSLLAMFGVWSLILAILLGRYKRLDLAMILGMILGGAMLTKSPGMMFMAMAPVVILFRHSESRHGGVEGSLSKQIAFKRDSSVSVGMTKKLFLVAVAISIAFVIYNILRLGPNFQMIAIRNKDYVFSIREVIKHPLHPLLENLEKVASFYWVYLTPVGFVLGILGMVYGMKEIKKLRNLEILIIFAWLFFPILGQSFVARMMTSRYVLYGVPLFIMFLGYELWKIKNQKSKIKNTMQNAKFFGILFLFFIPMIIFDWKLLNNPKTVSFAREDAGYIEDWTSGWGVKETANYLRQLPKDKHVVIGTEGYFGTLPDGLQTYLEGEKDVTAIGVGYPISSIPESLLNAKRAGDRVYLLVNRSRFRIVDGSGLQLIKKFEKPGGDSLLFYEILDI